MTNLVGQNKHSDLTIVTMATKLNKVTKYVGDICFQEIEPLDKVKRVIFRKQATTDEIVLDFITSGYHYTAILKMKEPDSYSGQYTCEVDGKMYTDVADCTVFRNKNEILLQGTWVEDGNRSFWYCRLHEVPKFPDEK